MPHQRKRHLLTFLQKQSSFWPVVGVLGLRQVGKSTLLRDLVGISPYLSFDDEDIRSDAGASAQSFLAKLEPPLVIDEVQKVPAIFDAIKSAVDRKRVPGSYFVTGSSAFSALKDIRESLTGRIGLCELFPLTLAEADEKPYSSDRLLPIHSHKVRFSTERLSAQLTKGGLPVPMFSRDSTMRLQYWDGWIATTLGRDLSRVYGKGYDADFAEKVLMALVQNHQAGIFPDLSDFRTDSRKTKKYLNAFRSIFMVRMLPCNEIGTGRDIYFLSDSGLAHALMKHAMSESISHSLVKIFVLNEIIANTHYTGATTRWNYYKSRKGSEVDLIWNNIPIKIIGSMSKIGWEERAVYGAMKKLGSEFGLLAGPTSLNHLPKKNQVGSVPWTFWS